MNDMHAHMYGHMHIPWDHKHILSYLSVCNVSLTVRASPRATPPSSPIIFLSRLQLEIHTVRIEL